MMRKIATALGSPALAAKFGAVSMTLQYRIMTWIVWMAFSVRARLVVEGRENLPVATGFIVASNHLSNWDPVAVGMAMLHRQMHPVGKQELFDIPVLGKIPPWLGGIPVRRGAVERETINQCRDVLKSGQPVLMLPEGTRSRTGGLIEGKPGLIFVAQLARVPIVPIAVWGTERMGWPWRRATVHVRFGPPMHIERGRGAPTREQLVERLMVRIAHMLPSKYHGIYAAAAAEAAPLPDQPAVAAEAPQPSDQS